MKNFDGINAIIFGLVIDMNDNIVPMGSLYDSLEYLMKIYETNKDIHLIFHLLSREGRRSHDFLMNSNANNLEKIKDKIRLILDGKYLIDDYGFIDNIHIVDLKKLFWNNHLNKILTIDLSTPRNFKRFIARANEIFIIPELTKPTHFYQSKVNKVTYFTEMPFCHCDVEYKMKFDFDRLKPIDSFQEKLYVNYPKLNINDDQRILNEIQKINKPLLIKENQFLYDLHNHFDEYVYFQSNAWFDPHPKLFHECKYYNKPYHYFNWRGVKDGAYYRYYDSLTENLNDRQINKDDIIVQRMSD